MSPRSTLVERVGDVAQLGERLNRTQEADGSIPFISTILLRIFSLHRGEKTFEEQTFSIQAALSWLFGRPPASTVSTFCWRALDPAPDLA